VVERLSKDCGRLVTVGDGDISNGIVEIQHFVEKFDQNVLVCLVAKDFLEGYVCFRVYKFHACGVCGIVLDCLQFYHAPTKKYR
jgi:hypothetical protein